MADNPSVILGVGADTTRLEQDILRAVRRIESRPLRVGGSGGAAGVIGNQGFGSNLPLGRITGQANEFERSMRSAEARVLAFGIAAGSVFAVTRAIKELVKSTINVEKSLADINVILNQSQQGLNKFGDSLFNIAKKTGQSFTEVSKAALEFSRQGLSVEETLKRTRDALILVRLTGASAEDAVKSLTAAVNSFYKEGVNTTQIINKLATVDAAFAVSSNDLSEAIRRVGSTAEDAGVSLDQLIALVTAAQQTTARGGTVIGNAFKTIFTRLERPKVLDELARLGIAGNSTIEILQNLAGSYSRLNDAQKSHVTELVGGVFQINVLKATLSDLTKEYSVYSNALKISGSATDEAIRRNEKLNQTMAAQANETVQTMTQAAAKIGKLAFGPAIKNILGGSKGLFGQFNKELGGAEIGNSLGNRMAEGLLKGIGSALAGPGLAVIGIFLSRMLGKQLAFAGSAAKGLLFGAGDKQKAVEMEIRNIMLQETQIRQLLASTTMSQIEKEMILTQKIRERILLREQENLIMAAASRNIMAGGGFGKMNPQGELMLKNKAGGYIPAAISESRAIQSRVGGVSSNERPVPIPNFSIGGRRQTVMANTGEYVTPTSSIIPRYSGPDKYSILNPSMIRSMGSLPYNSRRITDSMAADGFVPNYGRTALGYGEFRPNLFGLKDIFSDPKGTLKRLPFRVAGTAAAGLYGNYLKAYGKNPLEAEPFLGAARYMSGIGGVKKLSLSYSDFAPWLDDSEITEIGRKRNINTANDPFFNLIGDFHFSQNKKGLKIQDRFNFDNSIDYDGGSKTFFSSDVGLGKLPPSILKIINKFIPKDNPYLPSKERDKRRIKFGPLQMNMDDSGSLLRIRGEDLDFAEYGSPFLTRIGFKAGGFVPNYDIAKRIKRTGKLRGSPGVQGAFLENRDVRLQHKVGGRKIGFKTFWHAGEQRGDEEIIDEYITTKLAQDEGLPVAKVHGSPERAVERGGLVKDAIQGKSLAEVFKRFYSRNVNPDYDDQLDSYHRFARRVTDKLGEVFSDRGFNINDLHPGNYLVEDKANLTVSKAMRAYMAGNESLSDTYIQRLIDNQNLKVVDLGYSALGRGDLIQRQEDIVKTLDRKFRSRYAQPLEIQRRGAATKLDSARVGYSGGFVPNYAKFSDPWTMSLLEGKYKLSRADTTKAMALRGGDEGPFADDYEVPIWKLSRIGGRDLDAVDTGNIDREFASYDPIKDIVGFVKADLGGKGTIGNTVDYAKQVKQELMSGFKARSGRKLKQSEFEFSNLSSRNKSIPKGLMRNFLNSKSQKVKDELQPFLKGKDFGSSYAEFINETIGTGRVVEKDEALKIANFKLANPSKGLEHWFAYTREKLPKWDDRRLNREFWEKVITIQSRGPGTTDYKKRPYLASYKQDDRLGIDVPMSQSRGGWGHPGVVKINPDAYEAETEEVIKRAINLAKATNENLNKNPKLAIPIVKGIKKVRDDYFNLFIKRDKAKYFRRWRNRNRYRDVRERRGEGGEIRYTAGESGQDTPMQFLVKQGLINPDFGKVERNLWKIIKAREKAANAHMGLALSVDAGDTAASEAWLDAPTPVSVSQSLETLRHGIRRLPTPSASSLKEAIEKIQFKKDRREGLKLLHTGPIEILERAYKFLEAVGEGRPMKKVANLRAILDSRERIEMKTGLGTIHNKENKLFEALGIKHMAEEEIPSVLKRFQIDTPYKGMTATQLKSIYFKSKSPFDTLKEDEYPVASPKEADQFLKVAYNGRVNQGMGALGAITGFENSRDGFMDWLTGRGANLPKGVEYEDVKSLFYSSEKRPLIDWLVHHKDKKYFEDEVHYRDVAEQVRAVRLGERRFLENIEAEDLINGPKTTPEAAYRASSQRNYAKHEPEMRGLIEEARATPLPIPNILRGEHPKFKLLDTSDKMDAEGKFMDNCLNRDNKHFGPLNHLNFVKSARNLKSVFLSGGDASIELDVSKLNGPPNMPGSNEVGLRQMLGPKNTSVSEAQREELRTFIRGKGLIPNFAKALNLPLSIGFVPSFSNYKPLTEAINREVGVLGSRGVLNAKSHVYVSQDGRLKNTNNPMGLMVANRIDEPHGGYQGLSRAMREGANIQRYGAASGLIPNFATIEEGLAIIERKRKELILKRQGRNPILSREEYEKGLIVLEKEAVKIKATGFRGGGFESLPPSTDFPPMTNTGKREAWYRNRIPPTESELYGPKLSEFQEYQKYQRREEFLAPGREIKSIYGDKSIVSLQKARGQIVLRKLIEEGEQIMMAGGSFPKNSNIRRAFDYRLRTENSEQATREAQIAMSGKGWASTGGVYGILGGFSQRKFDKIMGQDQFATMTPQQKERLGMMGRETGRMQMQHRALNASFILPMVGQTAMSIANLPEGQASRKMGGIIQGASTGLAVGAMIPGPIGLAIGGTIATVTLFKSVIDNLTPSFEDLAKKTQELSSKVGEQINASQEFLIAQSNFKEIAKEGNAVNTQTAADRITASFEKITDSGLKSKLIGKPLDEQQSVIAKYQAEKQKGISKLGFETAGAGFDTENQFKSIFTLGMGLKSSSFRNLGTSNQGLDASGLNRFTRGKDLAGGRKVDETMTSLANEFLAAGYKSKDISGLRADKKLDFFISNSEIETFTKRVKLLEEERAEMDKLIQSNVKYNVGLVDMDKKLSRFITYSSLNSQLKSNEVGNRQALNLQRAGEAVQTYSQFWKPETVIGMNTRLKEGQLDVDTQSQLRDAINKMTDEVGKISTDEKNLINPKSFEAILKEYSSGNLSGEGAIKSLDNLINVLVPDVKNQKGVDDLTNIKADFVKNISLAGQANAAGKQQIGEADKSERKRLKISQGLSFMGGAAGGYGLDEEKMGQANANINYGFSNLLGRNQRDLEATYPYWGGILRGKRGRRARFNYGSSPDARVREAIDFDKSERPIEEQGLRADISRAKTYAELSGTGIVPEGMLKDLEPRLTKVYQDRIKDISLGTIAETNKVTGGILSDQRYGPNAEQLVGVGDYGSAKKKVSDLQRFHAEDRKKSAALGDLFKELTIQEGLFKKAPESAALQAKELTKDDKSFENETTKFFGNVLGDTGGLGGLIAQAGAIVKENQTSNKLLGEINASQLLLVAQKGLSDKRTEIIEKKTKNKELADLQKGVFTQTRDARMGSGDFSGTIEKIFGLGPDSQTVVQKIKEAHQKSSTPEELRQNLIDTGFDKPQDQNAIDAYVKYSTPQTKYLKEIQDNTAEITKSTGEIKGLEGSVTNASDALKAFKVAADKAAAAVGDRAGVAGGGSAGFVLPAGGAGGNVPSSGRKPATGGGGATGAGSGAAAGTAGAGATGTITMPSSGDTAQYTGQYYILTNKKGETEILRENEFKARQYLENKAAAEKTAKTGPARKVLDTRKSERSVGVGDVEIPKDAFAPKPLEKFSLDPLYNWKQQHSLDKNLPDYKIDKYFTGTTGIPAKEPQSYVPPESNKLLTIDETIKGYEKTISKLNPKFETGLGGLSEEYRAEILGAAMGVDPETLGYLDAIKVASTKEEFDALAKRDIKTGAIIPDGGYNKVVTIPSDYDKNGMKNFGKPGQHSKVIIKPGLTKKEMRESIESNWLQNPNPQDLGYDIEAISLHEIGGHVAQGAGLKGKYAGSATSRYAAQNKLLMGDRALEPEAEGAAAKLYNPKNVNAIRLSEDSMKALEALIDKIAESNKTSAAPAPMSTSEEAAKAKVEVAVSEILVKIAGGSEGDKGLGPALSAELKGWVTEYFEQKKTPLPETAKPTPFRPESRGTPDNRVGGGAR